MTYPPSLLVRSGRRFGAGPGHQPATPGLGRALTIALLLGLCTALVVLPACVATLSMVSGVRLDVLVDPWVTRLTVMPVLETGRMLMTVALAATIIRSPEFV